MELRDEHLTSPIEDMQTYNELQAIHNGFRTAASWVGGYVPASTNPQIAPYANFNKDHYDIYLWFIEHHMEPGASVLEIGSASGARSMLLSRYADSVVGIEKDERRYKFACEHNQAPNIRFINGTFPMALPEGEMFDSIFCVSVLYQDAVPVAETIKAAMARLNPSGKLFVYDHGAMVNRAREECPGTCLETVPFRGGLDMAVFGWKE